MDGSFGLVQLVIARDCKLIVETGSFDSANKGFGDFIVETEEATGESASTEVGITFFEGVDKDKGFS